MQGHSTMKLVAAALCLIIWRDSSIFCEGGAIAALNVDNVIGNETNIDSKVSMPAVHDVFIHDGRALPADSNQILKFGAEKEYVAGLDNLLGKGTFGKVYRALDTNTGRHVAVKTERADLDKPTLPREYQNYQTIGPHRGIPDIYYFGKTDDGNSFVLAMQLLGKSLAQLRGPRNRKFKPKTVYLIGIQLMHRIELVHRKRLVYRDIKPENMAINIDGNLIYIFDFGISRKFVDAEGRHLPEGGRIPYGSGTPRYMSAYAHTHSQQSRRDDMESIGYMLMSFLTGSLPWDEYRSKADYVSIMIKMKENLNNEVFCNGYPQMEEYFDYVREDLEFTTKPDYAYLRALFREALESINEVEDFVFDWTTTEYLAKLETSNNDEKEQANPLE